eukprot:gene23636-9165_t
MEAEAETGSVPSASTMGHPWGTTRNEKTGNNADQLAVPSIYPRLAGTYHQAGMPAEAEAKTLCSQASTMGIPGTARNESRIMRSGFARHDMKAEAETGSVPSATTMGIPGGLPAMRRRQ